MSRLAAGRRGLVVMSLVLLGSGATSAGDDPPKPAAPLTLFDSRTLEGWKPVTGKFAGSVGVQDARMTLATGNPMTGVTCERVDLPKTNYTLTFEARRTAGNDFFAAATFPVGSSFVTLVNGGWGGSVTGLSLVNGANASENATNHFVKYQNDIWYTFEIQVTDSAIRCLVDGKEVFVLDHADTQLTTRIETRGNQPLGFASYRSAGEIRNIKVKPMTPAEVAEVNARIKTD